MNAACLCEIAFSGCSFREGSFQIGIGLNRKRARARTEIRLCLLGAKKRPIEGQRRRSSIQRDRNREIEVIQSGGQKSDLMVENNILLLDRVRTEMEFESSTYGRSKQQERKIDNKNRQKTPWRSIESRSVCFSSKQAKKHKPSYLQRSVVPKKDHLRLLTE